MLRALLAGRLVFAPGDGLYTFEGRGTITSLLRRQLAQGVAGPTGRDRLQNSTGLSYGWTPWDKAVSKVLGAWRARGGDRRPSLRLGMRGTRDERTQRDLDLRRGASQPRPVQSARR